MAQKIVNADMIAAISRGAQSGLTAIQIASMLGVRDTTVRKHAKKHDIEIIRARKANSTAIQNEQARRKERIKKRERQQKERQIKKIMSDLSKISNPHERKEFTYGQALLAFERKQVSLGLRQPLPHSVLNPIEPEKPKRKMSPRSNVAPIVICGVKFKSRTAAAEALGLGRSVFSSLIHPKATAHKKTRLIQLVSEYKRTMVTAQP